MKVKVGVENVGVKMEEGVWGYQGLAAKESAPLGL